MDDRLAILEKALSEAVTATLNTDTQRPVEFLAEWLLSRSSLGKRVPDWYASDYAPGSSRRENAIAQRSSWERVDRVFKDVFSGDSGGLGARNLSKCAKVVSMSGWNKQLSDVNERDMEAAALLNYDLWFGRVPPDHLRNAPGYHPHFLASVLGLKDFEGKVLFSEDRRSTAQISLELPREMEVQEVGWTFTPWDRNNCTSFQVTTTDSAGRCTQWDTVDVPRTTAAQVINSVMVKTGFDISPAIGQIEPAVRASRDVYKAALQKMRSEGGKGVEIIQAMEDYTVPKDPAAMLQPTNELELLYEDAAHAQRFVKSIVAPRTEWAATEINETWKMAYNKNHGEGAHRNFRAIKATDGVIHGLQAVVDPGLKSRERATAKASYKYRDEQGNVQWRRLRDLSRFALEFENAKAQVEGIKTIEANFTVLQCENRFRQPTPLGWSDISFLLKVDVPTSRGYHIAELQCYLKDFAEARDLAHSYYETIRSELPGACRIPINELDRVQYIVNEELVEGRQIHRGKGSEGKEYLSTTMARMPGHSVPTKLVDIKFEGTGNSGYGGQRLVFLHIFGPVVKQ